MNWNNIRLELARTAQFPRGSPHRCYLLHLPLEAGGLIDEALVRAYPMRATVRRFWPSQPDLRGNVIKTPDGWAFRYESRAEGDETVFSFDTHPIQVGECIIVTEPDGERIPLWVTNVQPIS
jgi:hypothetical protein